MTSLVTELCEPDVPAIVQEAELLAAIRLIRTPSIGARTFYELIRLYRTAQKAMDAVPHMARRGGRQMQLADVSVAERELTLLSGIGARTLLWSEAAYPVMLKQLGDAPPVLSVLGDAALLNTSSIAMVGARNASLNGMRFAETLAFGIAERGHSVVSGLARGIDTAAHKGAGARNTVAVLGGGVDHIYPRENAALYHAIAEQGCIVSECPPGIEPRAEHFPRRNRIISGLSLGTVVVEAAMRSGSLITARFALEQGREVMAVPGFPLDPRAEGPNKLIRDGATLVTGAEDVLEAVNSFTRRNSPEHFALEEDGITYAELDERTVDDIRIRLTELITTGATPVDELIAACGGEARAVLAALLELELAGQVTRYPGNKVGLLK